MGVPPKLERLTIYGGEFLIILQKDFKATGVYKSDVLNEELCISLLENDISTANTT